jgi:hypothetical protein
MLHPGVVPTAPGFRFWPGGVVGESRQGPEPQSPGQGLALTGATFGDRRRRSCRLGRVAVTDLGSGGEAPSLLDRGMSMLM